MTQTYAQARMLPGRSPVALVTAGLHAGAFLLFAGAAGWVPTGPDAGPMLGFVIDEAPTDRIVPPPPQPREASGSELLGESLPLPPEDFIANTLPTLSPSLPDTSALPGPAASGEPAAAPGPVEMPLGYRVRRSQDLFYPAASLRLGEEGSVDVRVCTDAAGAVSGTPQVLRGSGHPRLDAAAVAWATEGLQYQAATRDGVPLAACKGFRLQFRLTR